MEGDRRLPIASTRPPGTKPMAGPHRERLHAQKSQKRVVETPSIPSKPGFEGFEGAQSGDFSDFLGPYSRVIAALEARGPDLIPADRWQAAVGDGRAYLAQWCEAAEPPGWTVRDPF